MKFLQKILTTIACLVFLVVLFVAFCIFNPDFTKEVGGKIGKLSSFLGAKTEESETEQLTSMVDAENQSEDKLEDSLDNLVQTLTTELETELKLYEIPLESELDIPSRMLMLNGLIPLEEEAKEIEPSRADEIEQYLGVGETGEDWTFSKEFYPYFFMLDEKGQSLYRQIYANALEKNASFAPICETTRDELGNAIMAVTGDHPEIFWLECGYRCKYIAGGKVAEITLLFNETAEHLEKSKQVFDESLEKLVDYALRGERPPETELEKERALMDSLMEYVRYESNAPLSQSAYSAVVQGETVCAGYAKAFVLMCRQAEIPCYYCTGYAGEPHAWNIVRLDGIYRNVDVTWEDETDDHNRYFNKSDQAFSKDHIRRDLSIQLPVCEQTEESEEDELENVAEEQPLNEHAFNPNAYYGYNDDTTLRTLEQVGVVNENVKTDLKDYYDACYNKIMESTEHEITFSIAVHDYQLMEDIYNSYYNHSYEAGYGERTLRDLGADSWTMRVNIEALQGDNYLIMHTVTY